MSEPCQQEETINDIDSTVHNLKEGFSKQEGWFKTSTWVVSIAVMVIGGLSGVILGKLSSIEALLTAAQVVQGRLEERYIALDKRVSDIEKKHDTIEQTIRDGFKH